jgi:hypothetical protein
LGAKNDGMRNIFELLINAVSVERLKMLTGLDQNGKGYSFCVHFKILSCCLFSVPVPTQQLLSPNGNMIRKPTRSPVNSIKDFP